MSTRLYKVAGTFHRAGPYQWNDRYRESAAFSNSEASEHVGVQPAQSFSQQQRQHSLGSVPQSQVYSGGWVYHQRSNSWVYSHYTARKTARNLDDLHFDWENRWEAVKCDNPLDQLMKYRQP